MKKFIGLVFSLLVASSAFALSQDQAKSQGILGETPTGYLELVNQDNPDALKLMQEINQKRKIEYQKIATRHKTALNLVESLAGKQAIEKTAQGQYVKSASGAWLKKSFLRLTIRTASIANY